MNRRNNKPIEQKKGAHIFKNLDLKEKTDISKSSNKQVNSIIPKLQKNKNSLINAPNENDKTSAFSNNIYTYNIYDKERDIKPPSQQNINPNQQNKNTISNDTLKNTIKSNGKLTSASNKYTLKTKNLLSEKNITNKDSYISSGNVKNKYNQAEKNQIKKKNISTINIKGASQYSNNANKNIQGTNLLHQKKSQNTINDITSTNITIIHENEVNKPNLEKKKIIINHPVEILDKNNDKNNFDPIRKKNNDDKYPSHSTVNYKIEKKLLKENIFNKNVSSIMKEKSIKIKSNIINNPENETDKIKTSIYKKIVINNNILKKKQETNSLITDKKNNDSQNNKKFKRIIPYNLPSTKKNKNENIETCITVAYPISSNIIYNNKENIKKINEINTKINSLSIPISFNSIENSFIKNDKMSTNIGSKPVSFNYNNLSYIQKTAIHPKESSVMNIKNGQKILNKSNIRNVNISEKIQTKSTNYYPRNGIKPLIIKNKNKKNENSKHTDQIEKKKEVTDKTEVYINKNTKNNENDNLNKKFICKITNKKSYISVKNIKMENNSNITINNSSEKNNLNTHTNQENILKMDNSELVNQKTGFLFPETIETLKEIHIHHKINLNNSKDNNLFSLQYKNNNIIEGNDEFCHLPNQGFYPKDNTKNKNFNNSNNCRFINHSINKTNNMPGKFSDNAFYQSISNMPQMKQSYDNITPVMNSTDVNIQTNLGKYYDDNKYIEHFNNIESENYNNNTIVESSGICQDGDKILITVKPMDSTDSIITSNIENGFHGINCQNYILRKNFNPDSKEYNLLQTNKMNNTMLNPKHESVQIGLKFDEMKRRSFENFNYNTQVENNLSKNNKDMLSKTIVKNYNTKKQKSRNTIELIQNEDKSGLLKKRKLSYNVDTHQNSEQRTSSFFKKTANPKPTILFNPSIRNIIEKVVGKHLILKQNILNYKNANKKENTIKLNNQQLNNNNNNFNVKNIYNRLKQRNTFNPLNNINLTKSPFIKTQYSHISNKINTGNELSQNSKNKDNMSVNILLKKFPPQKFEMSPNINNILNICNNHDKNNVDIKSETQNSYINNNTMPTNLKKTNNIIFNSQIKSCYKKDLNHINNFSKNRQPQTIKYENDGNNLDSCIPFTGQEYQNKKEINNVDNNKNRSQLNYGYRKLEDVSSILLETRKDENKINSMDPTDEYNNIINKFINNGSSQYDKESKPTQCTMTCTKNEGEQNESEQNENEILHNNSEKSNCKEEINCNKNPNQNIEDKAFNLSAMLIEKKCKDKKIENIKMDNDNKIDETKQFQNEQIDEQNFETSKKKIIISPKKENIGSKCYRTKTDENKKTIHDDTYPISGCQKNTNDKHSKKYINNKTYCSDLSHNEDIISGKKASEKKISEHEKNVDAQREGKQRKNLGPNSFQIVKNKIIEKNKMKCTNSIDEKIEIVKKNKNIHTTLLSIKSNKNQNSNLKNFDDNCNKWETKTIASPEHVLNNNSKQNLWIENDNISKQNVLLDENIKDEEQKEVQPIIFNKHDHKNIQNFQNKNSFFLNDQMNTTQNVIHHLSNLDNIDLKKNINNTNANNNDNHKYIATSTQSESQNSITKSQIEDKIFNNTCLENYDTKIKMIDHKKIYIDITSYPEFFSNKTKLDFIWNDVTSNDSKDKDAQRGKEYTHTINHENNKKCENKENDKNSTIFQNEKHTEAITSQSDDNVNENIFKNRKKKWGKCIMSSNDNLDISLNNNDYDENEKNEKTEEEYDYTNVNNKNYLFNSFIYDVNINNEELSNIINCEENYFDINKDNKQIYNDNNLPIQFSSPNCIKTTNKRLSLFTPTNDEKTHHEAILCDKENDLTHLFTFNIQTDSIQGKPNIEENNSQIYLSNTNKIESKIDHNICQEQTEISDNDNTNMIYRKLKNVFFNKINKYVKNDSPKNTSVYIASDNSPFEHTIEEVKRKKKNQSITSNKKSKPSMIRKNVRANSDEDANTNLYEKHYINRRKKNEYENNTNSQKETSDIYTNDIIDIKIKKNEIPENSETTKTDTEIVTQLNDSDHISTIPNNQDSDNFSLKTSKTVSLYDQVDGHGSNCTEYSLCHDTPENYATNNGKENMDEKIENELIIEKKEVHTKYLEIEEYTAYTKNIFDNTFFTNMDAHSYQKSMYENRCNNNNICQENNIIKKNSIDVVLKDNDINDKSEKLIIQEKNITEMDTKTNLLLNKIKDNKLSENLIKNRIEAEKLNNEIPYITNIYKEMHRSSVMPLRIEAFHSLEDKRLIYGNPDWQKYFCPLCDQKYYPPNVYVKNYMHYLNEHWNNRKNLGGYIIFPCKLEHDNNEKNPSETKVDPGVTSYNGSKKWKKKKKKMKRNTRLYINPHYHCPLCLHLQFNDYELLVEHCTKFHKSTGADPTRTLPSNFMHTPFINNNDHYCSIKKNETDTSSNDILDSDQSDNKIISESKKKGDPLFHDPPSQSNLTLEFNNLKKNKMKNRRISKVAFCEEIQVREYDIELSKIEKFGASIGPVFNDDKEDPSNVRVPEDSLNHPSLLNEPNESMESSKLIDVIKSVDDPFPISEKSLSENRNNDFVENSTCNKKGSEDKIKECVIPQNNNQNDSTNLEKYVKLDTKTKNDDKIDIDVYDDCPTSIILNNNNNKSHTYKKNRELSKNDEHTGYTNNTQPKSIHLENDDDNNNYTHISNNKNNILKIGSTMMENHAKNNCLFRDDSKILFLDKNESNHYNDECVLNSTADESTNETDDQQYSNQNDDNKTFTNINPFRQKNKNKQNLPNNISNNSLSSLLSLECISDSKINDIIPDSKDEYEKILQIKEQHFNEILLENIKENQKEHTFNQNDNKQVGQFIKKRIGNIHKNIISKYKRKIKMSTIQDPKQREIKETNSYLKNKYYENIYIPPKNINLTLNNKIENIPLKKVIRTKKKEKITTQRINCRKSSRNKNKITQ